MVLAAAATGAAQLLIRLIDVTTQLAWHGRLSLAPSSPADNHLGLAAAVVPVIGGLLVGLLARYGSPAIRGHGIPEAMEQVLVNESRIPARLTFLKPLSAAISIGTGGPFGAEGPIIATGGALGSLLGQVLHTSADERKVLLAAGASAGMAATFGTPLAAVLLAIELLLFEFRARSFLPVALAAATAVVLRTTLGASGPMFSMQLAVEVVPLAALFYLALGGAAGVLAVGLTRALYWIEDAFERLPIHWMWWPALGAVVVGMVGLFAPRTLGVGYNNLQDILDGGLVGRAAAVLALWKLASWLVSLGSGTSGGTLAPIFTIGGGLGAAAGAAFAALFPQAGIDPRLAALVGMSATFAGASRAALTSAVFALEVTRQPAAMVPLLAGTAVALLVSSRLMRHSIMTEKIARRGVHAPGEYEADVLEGMHVAKRASWPVVTLDSDEPLEAVRARIASGAPGSRHQGYPVLDRHGGITGVVTRRDLLDPVADPSAQVRTLIRRPALCIGPAATLREAVEAMLEADVGRLPVVGDDGALVGILTRSDVLAAYQRRMSAARRPRRKSKRAA